MFATLFLYSAVFKASLCKGALWRLAYPGRCPGLMRLLGFQPAPRPLVNEDLKRWFPQLKGHVLPEGYKDFGQWYGAERQVH